MTPLIAALTEVLVQVLAEAFPTIGKAFLYQLALAQVTAVARLLGQLGAPPNADLGTGHARADDMTTAANVLHTQLLNELAEAARRPGDSPLPEHAMAPADLLATLRAWAGAGGHPTPRVAPSSAPDPGDNDDT